MKHEKAFDYLPAQRMRICARSCAGFRDGCPGGRPCLIEALIYEQASLLRQQSACLREARELESQRRAREKEAFFHE